VTLSQAVARVTRRWLYRLFSGEWPERKYGADGKPIHDALTPPLLHSLYRRRSVGSLLARHFNRAYYYSIEQTVYDTSWLGTTTVKYPTDLWAYQELIREQRPDLILETGTYLGGSALYLASICEMLDHGEVISIDVASGEYGPLPEHARISYLKGSSVDPALVAEVTARVNESPNVMVILDSLHTYDHVLSELRTYAPLVPLGGWLIVEDTNVNGHPVLPEWGPGPMEAVDAYLSEEPALAIDRSREKFMLTSNPCGFLRRTGSASPARD
jgi:cephalosporin hydroxylase